MALILCPECSKQISDKAKSCPGCGYPINNINSTLMKGSESVADLGKAAKNIASEVTTEDAKGCLSLIGIIVGVIAIISILIMSVMGYHFIGMGLICAGICVLIRKLSN